jgi:hypothetical protein
VLVNAAVHDRNGDGAAETPTWAVFWQVRVPAGTVAAPDAAMGRGTSMVEQPKYGLRAQLEMLSMGNIRPARHGWQLISGTVVLLLE